MDAGDAGDKEGDLRKRRGRRSLAVGGTGVALHNGEVLGQLRNRVAH